MRKRLSFLALSAYLPLGAVLVGWVVAAAPPPANQADVEIQAERAKLSPEDHKLVDAQNVCAVMQDSPLGEMGPPIKVRLRGKDGQDHPVFVCCKGCVKKAQRDPEKILAEVERLKAAPKPALKP